LLKELRLISEAEALQRAYVKVIDGIVDKGRVDLMVSGGSSLLPFLRCLTDKLGFATKGVTLHLSDERLLPESDTRRNAALLKLSLLKPTRVLTPRQTQVDGLTGYFFSMLSFGHDGHIASIFAPVGREMYTDARVLRISPIGNPLCSRETWNFSGLLRTNEVFIAIPDAARYRILSEALSKSKDGVMPVAIFLQRCEVPVYFFKAYSE